jgi:DNA polymerase
MDIVTLDFETYYSKDFSLSKKDTTTQSYIDSPEFETIGVGFKVNDGPVKWATGTHAEIKEELDSLKLQDNALLAHNALFDASILAWRFGIYPKLVLDTLSMSRAVHGVDVGGSLAALVKMYELGEKGDEVVHALGKRRGDFSAEELERYGVYCINDVFLTYCLFQILAPHFNKTEIALIDMTIKMHTTPTLELNREILEEHLATVRANKEALLEQAGVLRADLMSNDKLAEVLRSVGVEPPTKISARTGKEAYAFAKSDEAFKALLEHESPDVQAIVAARLGVKTTLEETRTERFIRIHESAGGVLPVPLKYYGAITGRWAGMDSINLQNLTRGSKLKKAIVAPMGYSIVGADLSNIELRVGLYFSGQLDKLNLLGEGIDLYKDFAASAFNVSYDEVTDEQRFVGKTSQLSLIYGTGHKKLRAQIKMLSGKDVGEEFAQRVVDVYRSEYSQVKASWYDAGRALDAIVNNEETEIGIGQLKQAVHGRKGILLPSGLHIIYNELEEFWDEGRKNYRYKTRKGPVHIHPAKCYQNNIQALARCVIGEMMVKINRRHPVVLTIHDSVYCVVPEQQANEALLFILNTMRTEPKWAPGIPLDAEGGSGADLAFKMKKYNIV